MRRTAFRFCWPWGQGTMSGRWDRFFWSNDNERIALRFIGQRNFYYCATPMQEYSARKRHEYGPFIRRLRAAVDCGVDFDRAPERSAGFCYRTRIWAFERAAPKTKQPLTLVCCD